METQLLYDAVTMSEAPGSAFELAAGFGLALLALALLNRWRRAPLGGLAISFAIAALVCGLLGAGLAYEQRLIARSADARVVQGPLDALWQRDAQAAGAREDYWDWQGFRIAGVDFRYARNLEQNYFHNAGGHAVALNEGMALRVHYLERHDGQQARRQIVRVERLQLPG